MYQALYRKYRPQSFEDIVGQGHVTTTLAREVVEGRVAHAYLFAGPRGTGKTTTARILAKSLNCENRGPDGSPDNLCPSCESITVGSSFDVIELDAASHNSVEDIREMRLSVTTVATSATSRRIYILDEAHMLSKAAGNALLKTLEEPPEHVHFVLATTEPYKLADTIRSRTQRFDFHPVGVEALAGHLARISDLESYKVEMPALVAVSRHAGGSVRDALSLLEQVAALGAGKVDLLGVHRALGMADADSYARLVEAIAGSDARAGLELVGEMAAQGIDLRRFVGEAINFLRGVFLAHYTPNLAEIADEPAEVIEGWKKASARLGAADALRAVDVLGEALVKLREGREERLMVELAVIKLTRPETAADPEALLARVERLERSRDQAPAVRETPEVPDPLLVPRDSLAEVAVVPSGPSDLSLERLNEIWPALFGGLRQVLGARRWAYFREVTPVAIEGNRIVLQVGEDFLLEGLQKDQVLGSVVATQASDLLGSQVEVEFRKSDGGFPVPVESLDTIELDKDRLFDAPQDATDPTALLEKELGATLIEEIITDGN
ncbi:MAG TPA: DNA polymerase III subunit gamma/tau [Acidimicrobiia bacterium]|nr:DNA polymerase III subunit gamma/tau [Acidimicrobiia bacterium]